MKKLICFVLSISYLLTGCFIAVPVAAAAAFGNATIPELVVMIALTIFFWPAILLIIAYYPF